MGVIFFRNGKPYVLEAVATVRYTPLDLWIARGQGRHFVIKRLRNAPAVLTPSALAKLRNLARSFQGRPYDLTFEWSDDRMYCSELVWKLYDRALGIDIGRRQRIRDLDLTDPIVRAKLYERYGRHIPRDEPVISPGAMFRSPLLETIAQK
jgi:Permuted papain-like amidase enzyme, YaeF/YiiX, C92 family